MQTICLPMTFSINDLMNHPQVREFLHGREQNYLDDLKWLDEDLDKKNKEEEENRRIQEENISRLNHARLLDEEERTRAAWTMTRLLLADSDSDSDSEEFTYESAYESDNSDNMSLICEPEDPPQIRRSTKSEGPTDEESKTQDIASSALGAKFQMNKRSLFNNDDTSWMIKKKVILEYLGESIEGSGWDRKVFLKLLYTDKNYVSWSDLLKDNGVKFRKNYTTGTYVIGAGNGWKNWKNEKKEYHCESLHFVKQIYDAMAKRQK